MNEISVWPLKSTEQYFPVALLITLHNVVLSVKSVWQTIQKKAIDRYFPVVLFIMLYKVVLIFFLSVDEIQMCL